MRNYKTKPLAKKISKNELLKCPLVTCNKKYKSERTRQQHVEKNHYYETRNSNHFKFNHDVRAQIYESAAEYIVELYEIRKCYESGECYGESLANNLLPQLYGKEVNPEDLKRITIAQSLFAKKLLEENLYLCDWNIVMDDLERFFNIGLPYYDTNFCPTLTIDFLWHAMMQRPNLYVDICRKSCIEIMPHCNVHRSEHEDTERYEYFLRVFQHKFERRPHTFSSSDISEELSSADARQIFIDLYYKELKEIENDRIRDEEKVRQRNEELRIREEEKIKQRNEELRIREEKRSTALKEISENVGISLEKLGSNEIYYYLYGYERGYRSEQLRNYVASQIKLESSRSLSSSC